MTTREELAILAELGIAFAGFLAVFLIFARREGRFSPADSLRVRSIIVSSLSAVFLALLPLALNLYGLEGIALWRDAPGLRLVLVSDNNGDADDLTQFVEFRLTD